MYDIYERQHNHIFIRQNCPIAHISCQTLSLDLALNATTLWVRASLHVNIGGFRFVFSSNLAFIFADIIHTAQSHITKVT
jgi:hypothetical protein